MKYPEWADGWLRSELIEEVEKLRKLQDETAKAWTKYTDSLEDEVEKLKDDVEILQKIISQGIVTESTLRIRNLRLRNFLELALDAHDDLCGQTDPFEYPKQWDVQARKLLDETVS
jgi:hypothetical protein